jgi:CheY-like chemotaxis protein
MQTTDWLLLVEDDCLDVAIMRRTLKQLNIPHELVHKTDGETALEYPRGRSGNAPCAILLDLNMPRMNGLEFLEDIKADALLWSVPVLVVTTSSATKDMEACFRLGAVAHIQKDFSFEAFVKNMRGVMRYCACGPTAAGE